MSESTRIEDESSRKAVLIYLAALSGDLATLARGHGLDTLGYILEMARLEAENTVHGSNIRWRGGGDRQFQTNETSEPPRRASVGSAASAAPATP